MRKIVKRQGNFELVKCDDGSYRATKAGVYVGYLVQDKYKMWQAYRVRGSISEKAGPKGNALLATATSRL